jgi:hypothetical protein
LGSRVGRLFNILEAVSKDIFRQALERMAFSKDPRRTSLRDSSVEMSSGKMGQRHLHDEEKTS